ncbi:16S rRNA (adenine(1518)-N(6)/adenine(1519)-N(6))-dimethyltransferase RsmA [Lichenibacterium ramalinae]|uniref:Ribosomal RNA small subunit methyltransferase A n=1 Tax=Lichenibacterium ramalinae TaxID=2316527 RepID=A0A4Q2RHT4_9HYPH|nr:16S rRNA (adenine(1518)-N(6)/adenine(1519)-N(6))-dimethyltransferase RsmA [Lichenibacterium ramalinae]RYB06324.1 16S rRNA (adenine(1518)-N(6)/adenine(1519)-N(6))-dimethyltransferase RsmA [Lichenibacterium ramalinae]
MTDDGLPPLRDVVEACGIEPSRALGQNFLFDLNLTGRIARAAGPLAGVPVVEVGPGPGGLTRALLAEGAEVVAVERDPRCLPALAAIAERYPGRLTVIAGDALAVLPSGLPVRADGRPWRIVANLPYNVATPLLTGWIEAEPWPPWFDRMVLMFQREVAERIVATPQERADYGRLGVLCGWRTRARILFDVAPSNFVPPPKVLSSIVELVPRPVPLPCSVASLSRVTAAAFGQRRKMLRQSLKGLATPAGSVDAAALLERAGIAGTARAETLTVADFVTLARLADGAEPLPPATPND